MRKIIDREKQMQSAVAGRAYDGACPPKPTQETQDMSLEEATLSQNVGLGALASSPTQRKRSPDADSRTSRLKRMKSSNAVEPIDVGGTK